MNLDKRILKIEQLLPVTIQDHEMLELEQVCEWLAQHSEDFVECVRQIFRLQCKTDQHTDDWSQWQEPYKQHASVYFNRINELIKEYIGNVKKSN